MLIAAVILFAIAALFGLTMALRHFQGKTPPPVALAQGCMACLPRLNKKALKGWHKP
ncbi:MAG: hypothetical protein OS130_12045 [Thermodesulfobacteriota bacterium]|jgi:hypothetical protein|nr:MAG: hypothetical protein OS130_12045 [Thermodesulfobacteriota bacterium]